jgi:hypothetical protein
VPSAIAPTTRLKGDGNMGVMLCLDRPGPARGQRHGHRARSTAGRATADAIAAFLRSGTSVAGHRSGRRAVRGAAAPWSPRAEVTSPIAGLVGGTCGSGRRIAVSVARRDSRRILRFPEDTSIGAVPL